MVQLKPVYEQLEIHPEVKTGRIREIASLAEVYVYHGLRDYELANRLGLESPRENPLMDYKKFFERTHLSRNMERLAYKVFGALAGKTNVDLSGGKRIPCSSRVYILPSRLGGGKTHTLIFIYYLALLYNDRKDQLLYDLRLLDKRFAENFTRLVNSLGGEVKVAVLAGDFDNLITKPNQPAVLNGRKLRTPWGILFHELGVYDEYRRFDEEEIVPGKDVFMEILKKKSPVLIIIDEPVMYLDSVGRGRPEYSKYLSFIKNLVEAVDNTPYSVLVMSIPAEYRGARLEAEQSPENVEELMKQVSRAAYEAIPPLDVRTDLSKVLIKRIFSVSEDARKRLADEIVEYIKRQILSDSTLLESINNRYGSLDNFLVRLRDDYPYHPFLIDYLTVLGTTNPEIGRTRRLLVLVSRIVRYIYEHKHRVPVAIIPVWSIPVDDPSIRAELLTGVVTSEELERIYQEDVINRSKDTSNSLLGRIIAITLWLTTIPGRGNRNIESLKLYPSIMDIPAIIYEPILFSKNEINGSTVSNIVDELRTVLVYIAVEDEKIFYAIVPDITKYIRERYLRKSDADALNELESFMSGLKPYGKFKYIHNLTTTRFEILNSVKDILLSNDEPALILYTGFNEPGDELDKLLVRNNVVVVIRDYSVSLENYPGLQPSSSIIGIIGFKPRDLGELLKSLLKLYSCIKEIRTDIRFLEEIGGRENVDILKRKLVELENSVKALISRSIIVSLRIVKMGVSGEIIDLYHHGKSTLPVEHGGLENLSQIIYHYLSSRGVRTEWSWDALADTLKRIETLWDERNRIHPEQNVGSIRKIWEFLLYSPNVYPHLTEFKDLVNALREGYERNIVAFRAGNSIIWIKPPVSENEIEYQKPNPYGYYLSWDYVKNNMRTQPIRFKDWLIMHPVYIVKDVVEELRSRIKVVEASEGGKAVVKLYVLTDEGPVDFNEFIETYNNPEILAEELAKHIIYQRIEYLESTFKLEVTSVNDNEYTGKPVDLVFTGSGLLTVKLVLDASDYSYPIQLRLVLKSQETREVIYSDEKTVEGSGEYSISISVETPGHYIAILQARGKDPKKYEHPPIIVAHVVVEGQRCYITQSIKGEELSSGIDKLSSSRAKASIELYEVVIRDTPPQYVMNMLLRLLAYIKKYSSIRISLQTVLRTRDEGVIEIKLDNADVVTAGKFLSTINDLYTSGAVLEKFEYLLKPGSDAEKLVRDNIFMNQLSDPNSLGGYAEVKLRVCEEVS